MAGRRFNLRRNLLDRQRETEGCALARHGFRGDPAAVTAQDALDDRETHPASLIPRRGRQALEDAEQPLRMPRVEADAVVAYRILDRRVAPAAGDRDSRARGLSRV